MRVTESACSMVENTQLPAAVLAYLEAEPLEERGCVRGGLVETSQGSHTYGWLASSSRLIVVSLAEGHKVAAWTFGAALRDLRPQITCVTELKNPLVEQTLQLLIGLDCEVIGGMVCLFHCNGSRILRAIQVDCQVVCLQYIDSLQGTPLDCFDGAVLIGTRGGGALIFDLNRYACTEAILCSDDSKLNIRDEFNITNLIVLSLDNINIIEDQRNIAFKKDHHIAIQINEACVHNLDFIIYNRDNTVRFSTERDNIFVSSVLFVPQLTSIVVGFNLGFFQLFNLINLELEYTSVIVEDQLPVTHIGFMEPCDDPKPFCYLWITYSVFDRHEEGFPLAFMYSLTYHSKENGDDNKLTYKNFLTCTLRFNIELSYLDGVSSGKQPIGGRPLVCHTLTKTTNKEDTDEYVLNLCQIVWECWTSSALAPIQTVMILFDIDQWYKDHMPDSCVLQTNNFMCVVNMGDTLIPSSNSYLCDVQIDLESLTSYCSVQKLEEHFYPNSLGYECYCLTNTGITKLITMGVQRQLLASINKIGPSILLHPTKLYNQCVNVGLVPLYSDLQPTQPSEQIQRQFLLSVALEARLIQFLGKCACDWASGSHTSVGCTLQFILDWSWSRTISLKQNGDLITIPFFDLSSTIPDKNSVQHLNSCIRQLGHITTLYNIIIDKCSAYMLPKTIIDVKQQLKIIQMVTQYFQVIQWFLNVGLLPEFRVDQLTTITNDKLPYPIESLIKFYQNRRLKLHCLSGESPAHEELQNKHCKLLFIDELIGTECSEKKLKKLWIEDESSINGLYPPPSLHSLLKIYLVPEIKEEYKHSLVLYMLIDYAMMFHNEQYENVIRRLMQFPTMFGLSNTAIKVTQAFWHLDHRDFELALNQLQWVLTGGCLTQWQHNVVLSALLIQKKTQAAIQYLHVRNPCMSPSKRNFSNNALFDDWETCSNIYLCRGLVYEAFNLHRDSIKDYPNAVCEERLKIFLEGCKKMGLLNKVLLLPLTQMEEAVFVKFLKSQNDFHSSNILVLYYLRRSRYIEAQQVNEELKRLTCKGQLPYDVTNDFTMRKDHVYKSEARDQLVDLYYKSLPPITRQLATIASVNTTNRKSIFPTPFTVNVQSNPAKSASYKSSFIQATIDKASEIWLSKPSVQRGIKRSFEIEETPFLCTPKLNRVCKIDYDEKMSTTPDESPSKRRKLNDDILPPETQNLSPKLQKDIEILLHTPLVERKPNWSIAGSINSRFSDRSSIGREATPRSILKIRHLQKRLVSSPIEERLLTETDDEFERHSDNLSRSIRFNISRTNSPSPISECLLEGQDSFEELCGHNAKKHENIINDVEMKSRKSLTPSPRKSIHIYQDSESIMLTRERSSMLETYLETPIFHEYTIQRITPVKDKSISEENENPPMETNSLEASSSRSSPMKSSSVTIDFKPVESVKVVNESILPSDTSDQTLSNVSIDVPQLSILEELKSNVSIQKTVNPVNLEIKDQEVSIVDDNSIFSEDDDANVSFGTCKGDTTLGEVSIESAAPADTTVTEQVDNDPVMPIDPSDDDDDSPKMVIDCGDKLIDSSKPTDDEIMSIYDNLDAIPENDEDITLRLDESAELQESNVSVLKNDTSIIKPLSVTLSIQTESSKNLDVSSQDASSELSTSESSILKSKRIRRRSKSEVVAKQSISSSKSINSDDSRPATPRRSSRILSKLDSSAMSDSSIESDRESSSSFKKARRSTVVSAKPNLTVIPEMSHTEDERTKDNSISFNVKSVIDELSSRRLTRHQKSLIEKSLEVSKTIPVIIEKDENVQPDEGAESDSDQDSVSCSSSVTAKTMDPILLLDKKSFEGQPDLDEQVNLNSSRASSVISDFAEITRPELTRAASEPRFVNKNRDSDRTFTETPKKLLRTSKKLDITAELNESLLDSPSSRSRRQSFNRAMEALTTPKRIRRLSTDSKASDSCQSLIANASERTTQSSMKESADETVVPVKLRRTKAASIHGEKDVSNLDDSDYILKRTRASKSIISTPLSKDDIMKVSDSRQPRYKRKTGIHKVVQPLQFSIDKN